MVRVTGVESAASWPYKSQRSCVYHQNEVLYIINGETVASHHCESDLIHALRVMIYSLRLMIYNDSNAIVGDIPLLSQWIKKQTKSNLVCFFELV